MNIELRSIKHSAFASEETYCYQAKVYVDGKHCANVSNNGHGGGDYQHPVKGAATSLAKIETWIEANHPPIDMSRYAGGDLATSDTKMDLEMLCIDLINDWLDTKEIKRMMASKVLLFDGEKVQGMSWKGIRKVTTSHIEAAAMRYPKRIILNRLTLDEAKAIMKQVSP